MRIRCHHIAVAIRITAALTAGILLFPYETQAARCHGHCSEDGAKERLLRREWDRSQLPTWAQWRAGSPGATDPWKPVRRGFSIHSLPKTPEVALPYDYTTHPAWQHASEVQAAFRGANGAVALRVLGAAASPVIGMLAAGSAGAAAGAWGALPRHLPGNAGNMARALRTFETQPVVMEVGAGMGRQLGAISRAHPGAHLIANDAGDFASDMMYFAGREGVSDISVVTGPVALTGGRIADHVYVSAPPPLPMVGWTSRSGDGAIVVGGAADAVRAGGTLHVAVESTTAVGFSPGAMRSFLASRGLVNVRVHDPAILPGISEHMASGYGWDYSLGSGAYGVSAARPMAAASPISVTQWPGVNPIWGWPVAESP